LLALGGVAASLSCVDTSSAQSPWSGWTHLRLKARAGALVTGSVDMRLTQGADDRLFETATVARLLGAKIAQSRTETRIDPGTGRIERYISQSKKRARRYEFGEEDCLVEKLVPTGDAGAPLEEWEVTSSERFPYPLTEAGESVRVFDYYGMLLHLRESDLEKTGDEITIFVATSHGIAPYRIAVEETRRVEREYEDLSTEENRRVWLRELRLSISSADPEADEGFLNMQGEIELWVEAESKTVLSIRGKAPNVPGRIEIELAGMG
jgi:hypothetical protein